MAKAFLKVPPALIVIFKQTYKETEDGESKYYYITVSVGIAARILISTIHRAGLVTLKHTPCPLNFLADLLDQPKSEKPFYHSLWGFLQMTHKFDY